MFDRFGAILHLQLAYIYIYIYSLRIHAALSVVVVHEELVKLEVDIVGKASTHPVLVFATRWREARLDRHVCVSCRFLHPTC